MKNINIIKTESMYGLIFITAKVLNDDKVAEIRVQCKEDNKQVQNILVKFHSGKSSTYSGMGEVRLRVRRRCSRRRDGPAHDPQAKARRAHHGHHNAFHGRTVLKQDRHQRASQHQDHRNLRLQRF